MTQIVPTHNLKNDGNGINDLVAGIATQALVAMEFLNDGNLLLFILNGSGGNVTVTVKANSGDRDGRGGTANDIAYTVAAGDVLLIPFLAGTLFNNSGQAQVTLSSATDVDYALVRMDKIFGGT